VKEGLLEIMRNGRWAVCAPGEEPIEITSGDQFYIEVPGAGAMELTRMEYAHGRGGGYYSTGGPALKPGLRAGFVGRGFL